MLQWLVFVLPLPSVCPWVVPVSSSTLPLPVKGLQLLCTEAITFWQCIWDIFTHALLVLSRTFQSVLLPVSRPHAVNLATCLTSQPAPSTVVFSFNIEFNIHSPVTWITHWCFNAALLSYSLYLSQSSLLYLLGKRAEWRLLGQDVKLHLE